MLTDILFCHSFLVIYKLGSRIKHYLIQNQGKGITFSHLKKTIKKVITEIDAKNYTNILKYAYKNKDNRKIIKKVSTRRRKPKTYIK